MAPLVSSSCPWSLFLWTNFFISHIWDEDHKKNMPLCLTALISIKQQLHLSNATIVDRPKQRITCTVWLLLSVKCLHETVQNDRIFVPLPWISLRYYSTIQRFEHVSECMHICPIYVRLYTKKWCHYINLIITIIIIISHGICIYIYTYRMNRSILKHTLLQ